MVQLSLISSYAACNLRQCEGRKFIVLWVEVDLVTYRVGDVSENACAGRMSSEMDGKRKMFLYFLHFHSR